MRFFGVQVMYGGERPDVTLATSSSQTASTNVDFPSSHSDTCKFRGTLCLPLDVREILIFHTKPTTLGTAEDRPEAIPRRSQRTVTATFNAQIMGAP